VVLEDLNHLDVAVVLGVVRSRSDWSPSAAASAGWNAIAGAQHWSRVLSSVFGAGAGTAAGGGDIWERPLPWEGQRITIMSFAETAATAAKGLTQSLGPRTLRKSSHMITPARMSEIVRASLASSKGTIIAPPGRADAAKAAKEKREKEMRAKALALQKAKAIAALRAKSQSQATATKGKDKGGNEEERAKAKAAALLDKDKIKKAAKADGANSEANKGESGTDSVSESKQPPTQPKAQGGGSANVVIEGNESSKSKASTYVSAGGSANSSQKASSQSQQQSLKAAATKSTHSQPGAPSSSQQQPQTQPQVASTGAATTVPSSKASDLAPPGASASASGATPTSAPAQAGVRSTAGLGFVKRETPPTKPSMMNRLSSFFGSKK
jgi:hypothetical protein